MAPNPNTVLTEVVQNLASQYGGLEVVEQVLSLDLPTMEENLIAEGFNSVSVMESGDVVALSYKTDVDTFNAHLDIMKQLVAAYGSGMSVPYNMQIAAEQMETMFKLATSSMGLGPDSGLEESGHGYEGGIQQMEEQKKYVHPNIIPCKYKQGDDVQFRGGGIGEDAGSKGKIISVRNDKVTIQWTEGKRKGKTHTLPKDSVILDRYIQII